MAFEKAKVLKNAEKFLSQGNIKAAIKEYRQIVENDEHDLTTLNMLGDLCAREGQNNEAISCFARIAEHYREQEFTLKAIAMYKKMERLKPRDPAIAIKLATLYAIQGRGADARAQYLIVADAYTRAGKTIQTLEVLHKIADLEPHNTESRVELAEGYLKEGLPSEAAGAFIQAGIRLYDTGQFEKALKSYSKALELRPYEETALKGVVLAHIALGTAEEAAELLEKVVAEGSNNPELVSMLARTYIAAEDGKNAERATSMLMAQDGSNYLRFLEVAQLYLKNGEVDEATRILTSIVEQLLAGREESDLLKLVNEVLAGDPKNVAGLRLLIRIRWWQRDMKNLRAVLERLVETAATARLVDDERYALTQLIRLAPDEERFSMRLTELGGVQEDSADEDFLTRDSSLAEVPSFESLAMEADVDAVASSEADAGSQAAEFEWNSVAELASLHPTASFAELNEALEAPEASFAPEGNRPDVGFESSGAGDNEMSTAQQENETPALAEGRLQSLLRQELESVDFYITQGYADVAADTLDLVERQFGSHPEIDSRRETLKDADQLEVHGAGAAPEMFEFGAEPLLHEAETETLSAADIAFAATQETGSEADEVSSGNSVSASPFAIGIDAGLAEIFEEFRVAAEEPSAEEDYETHYNRGTAYKEMDLLDEAIQEFQAAASLATPADGTSRYLQCCNLLGHCFVQKEIPRAAVIWFKKGLEAPGHREDEYQALRYELGRAYEQMGDLKRALDMFTEVYGVDVSYRGVSEKLRELQAQKSGKKRRSLGKP